jgi:NADP-dependent 3-hydroxy acid dehydrogenase YdfG
MTSDSPQHPIAVVTGASSGIGAATARWLADAGFDVIAAARRIDRVEALASERADGRIRAAALDVTDGAAVQAFAAEVDAASGPAGVAVLVNNAGAAYGVDPIERADPGDWRAMYEVNVLGVLRLTQALLPALERGAGGHVVVTGSIAGRVVYEGGAGYTGVKHAVAAFVETLRLELNGRPIRVTEIAPGMVETEFSEVRLGDAERAKAVYEGMQPLTADDIAECIGWAVTRPPHVDIDLIVVKPLAQAAPHKVARRSGS